VLVATAFSPNSKGLGLEAAGVKVSDRGMIEVNEKMQTNVPGIWAIGDVTGKLMLAHVGSAMGIVCAENIAGHETITLDYEMMPRATYCHPQVASFGLTEAQAKERGYTIKIGRFPFQPNGKALGLGDYAGWVKIVMDEKYGEILGAHMIGPEVTDAVVILAGGNLNQSLTNPVVVGTSRVTNAGPNTLAMTLVPGTGLLKGTFLHPVLNRTIAFNGRSVVVMRHKTVRTIDPCVAVMEIDLLTAHACYEVRREGHERHKPPVPADRRRATIAVARRSSTVFGDHAGGSIGAGEAVVDIDLPIASSSTKICRQRRKGDELTVGTDRRGVAIVVTRNR
jgi:hypothetical protein